MPENISSNTQTEMALLGVMMLYSETIDLAVKNNLQADYFYSSINRLVYEAIFDIWSKQRPVSIITVGNRLKETVPENEYSRLCVLMENCIDSNPVKAHTEYYVKELKKTHDKINLDMVLEGSKEMLTDGEEVTSIVSTTISQLENIASDKTVSESFIETISKITKGFKSAGRGDGVYIPSRFIPIQRKTAGKRKGKITIYAARPGTGKTTLMVNEAKHDLDNGYKVGIISLEMDRGEILSLMACDEAALNLHKLNSGQATDEEVKKFRSSAMSFESKPLWIDDRTLNIHQIISWIRNTHRKSQLDIVYIDYIQLIKSSTKTSKKRHEEVADWSHLLAEVAKELGIPIVILSQIRRSYEPQEKSLSEKEQWKYVPRLDSLKDSGALEEDAYIVILLYPFPGNDSTAQSVLYVADVAKHRGGPTGHCCLVFKKHKQRFESSDRQSNI